MSDNTRKARSLIVSAAADMARLRRKMRRACMLVILDRMSFAEAAREVDRPRQNVYRAMLKIKPHLAEIEDYVARLERKARKW